ncbi:MAG TPA: sugar kinase [Halanaerobiales bacterium]|nr:sugar kinase [Halanaerobiales bacterium]
MSLLDSNYTFEDSDIDIISFGELLVDLITEEEEVRLSEAEQFSRYFGGSAANVAVNSQRLGAKTRMLTRIGDDDFGEFLLSVLKRENISNEGIQIDNIRRTPLVFVNKTSGTPAWLAYRDADKYIEFNEKVKELVNKTKIVYLTTFILSQKPSRKTALKVLDKIKKDEDTLLAFDPCYRPILWPEEDDGAQLVKSIISASDFIKPSLDDAEYLFGPDTPENYIEKYLQVGANIVILTMGEDGVLVSDGIEKFRLKVYSKKVVDVTGAGDSFWSGFMIGILDGMSIREAVKLGNATAAFKIRGVGALSQVPEKDYLLKFIKEQEAL